MKTLIVYDSKHGIVRDCAEKLEHKFKEKVTVIKISKKKQWPNIDEFDSIIIGASVHIGKIQKSIKDFCEKNLDKLKHKKVGIFLCSLTEPAEAYHYIEEQFPEELQQHAIIKSCFGGAVIFEKMNFVERFMMKKITKSSENINNVSEDAIESFVRTFQKE